MNDIKVEKTYGLEKGKVYIFEIPIGQMSKESIIEFLEELNKLEIKATVIQPYVSGMIKIIETEKEVSTCSVNVNPA